MGPDGKAKSEVPTKSVPSQSSDANPKPYEISSGNLKCIQCGALYPILAGVAIVVNDVRNYLLNHAKGIAHLVSDAEIPAQFRREFTAAKRAAQSEQFHIEEDLEAERVNALYVMNHYLRVEDPGRFMSGTTPWWQPKETLGSPLFDRLIRDHWDHGVFTTIATWLRPRNNLDVVELGCGVGGLWSALKDSVRTYLGTDSSFASIALSRHINIGIPYRGKILIPGDLLAGPVSRPITLPISRTEGKESSASEAVRSSRDLDGSVDYVVSEFSHRALQPHQFDVAIALNTLDMLDRPSDLPELKSQILKPRGPRNSELPLHLA